jgi:hypothetical protein
MRLGVLLLWAAVTAAAAAVDGMGHPPGPHHLALAVSQSAVVNTRHTRQQLGPRGATSVLASAHCTRTTATHSCRNIAADKFTSLQHDTHTMYVCCSVSKPVESPEQVVHGACPCLVHSHFSSCQAPTPQQPEQ